MAGPSKKKISAQQQVQGQASPPAHRDSASNGSTTLVGASSLPTPSDTLEHTVAAESWSPMWDYRGQDDDRTNAGSFAAFLDLIGPVAAPPTKLLRFDLADGLESSGVLDFLDIDFDNPSAAARKPLTDLQHSARAILCDAITTQRRALSAHGRLEPNGVYLKPVLDAYIKLLSACKDVECIDMPLAWACVFRAEDVFPKINLASVEDLELLPAEMRARWGRVPEDEERSLQLE
ncbi:hypothetical protein SLS60_009541 [Paraconiothyrium brasiliense]|uniref:Uncharacterized protein n=1 Tax=Paraconiothyrium brasiliense TaxID=300254 RepID=A0ABR3QUK5_9PLEO